MIPKLPEKRVRYGVEPRILPSYTYSTSIIIVGIGVFVVLALLLVSLVVHGGYFISTIAIVLISMFVGFLQEHYGLGVFPWSLAVSIINGDENVIYWAIAGPYLILELKNNYLVVLRASKKAHVIKPLIRQEIKGGILPKSSFKKMGELNLMDRVKSSGSKIYNMLTKAVFWRGEYFIPSSKRKGFMYKGFCQTLSFYLKKDLTVREYLGIIDFAKKVI